MRNQLWIWRVFSWSNRISSYSAAFYEAFTDSAVSSIREDFLKSWKCWSQFSHNKESETGMPYKIVAKVENPVIRKELSQEKFERKEHSTKSDYINILTLFYILELHFLFSTTQKIFCYHVSETSSHVL